MLYQQAKVAIQQSEERMTTNHLEFEGKNTEEAVNTACHYFGTTPEKLNIEVLSTGSTGIFGLVGSKKAKIRAALKKEEQLQPVTEKEHEETPELEDAKKILERMLFLLGVEAMVTGEQDADIVTLKVEGETTGILIGKKGSTLDAIQYIVNKVVTKNSSKRTRVRVDMANYRERHNQSLVDLALRLGEKVKKTGKPITISPMNPADRRVVHIALQNDRALKTKSKGEGLLKKIVIFPQREGTEPSTNTEA
jgi:spoIIIJ-associated protein